jgi:hypothetical protein
LSTLYRRVAHLAWRAVGEETVVLDLHARVLYGLDASGGRLLAALDAPLSTAELAARLAAVAPADLPAPSAQALDGFLGELVAAGLVEPAAPADEPHAAAPVAAPVVAPAAASPSLPDAVDGLTAALSASATSPRLLWREQLQEITHQISPTQQIGNPQCIF